MAGRFLRAAKLEGALVRFSIDGITVEAQAGESILAAVLRARGHIRNSENDGTKRAGFCLMGACQDCWVWLEGGGRARACTTEVAEGLRLFADPPPGFPGA